MIVADYTARCQYNQLIADACFFNAMQDYSTAELFLSEAAHHPGKPQPTRKEKDNVKIQQVTN